MYSGIGDKRSVQCRSTVFFTASEGFSGVTTARIYFLSDNLHTFVFLHPSKQIAVLRKLKYEPRSFFKMEGRSHYSLWG